jgi:hypothetical protein
MNETHVRKTYKETLAAVLGRCRARYNTGLEQGITAWQRCHVTVTRSQQKNRAEGPPRGILGVRRQPQPQPQPQPHAA